MFAATNIFASLFLVAAVAMGWGYATHKTAFNHLLTGEATSTETAANTDNARSTAAISTNTSLDADLSSIDASLGAASNASVSVDEGFNDTPIEQE